MRPGTDPVVVVGAGPVGCAAALLLAARGVRVEVLERHPAPYPLPRAVHLDDEVNAVLADLGVATAFAAVSRPMPGMRLVDARHRTLAEFRRDVVTGPLGWPQASMFDQPDLERILLQRLEQEPLVRLRRHQMVTHVDDGDRAAVVHHVDEATGSREQTVASAVLGCDGANSVVRESVGASMRDLHFRERWSVIDLVSPTPLPVWSGVHQVCDPARPATFMHITGDRYRWEFRVRPDEDPSSLTSPPALAALLAPWFPAGLPADARVVRHADYTFRALVADRWRSGRLFLLGDAAHQMPPFIGQGLGAGLRDASNLSWKLAGVLRGDLASGVLDTYEPERAPHVTRTVRTAVAVGWALTGGQDRAATVRKSALAVLCRLPGFGTAVLRAAPPTLGASRLCLTRPGGRSVGRPCPEVMRTPASDRGFVLISPSAPTATEANRTARLGVSWHTDPQARRAVLVRPDGIVAATSGAGSSTLLDLVAGVTARPTTATSAAMSARARP